MTARVRSGAGAREGGRARKGAPEPEGGTAPPSVAVLELDLDLFSGPFDLLLALILREEVDLLELSLADVVLAYLDHLESSGELDLEVATEFIVLVAALLELKSRLMLGGEEEQLLDMEPGEAAEELLARMLDARRFRAASAHLRELLGGQEGVRFREAPLPAELRRTIVPAPEGSHDPAALGAAIGRLLTPPASIDVRHIAVARVSVAERLAHLRELLRRGSFEFGEAVAGADRMTVAVTLYALLELYKRGEADWEQRECFGEISVRARTHEQRLPEASGRFRRADSPAPAGGPAGGKVAAAEQGEEAEPALAAAAGAGAA
jgi:segregation and condensation protein A